MIKNTGITSKIRRFQFLAILLTAFAASLPVSAASQANETPDSANRSTSTRKENVMIKTSSEEAGGPNTPASIRILSADLKNVRGPRSMVWQDCVGAGRVAEGLRAAWRDQLKVCKKECGFRYLRMHGLLEDELGAYSEDAQGNPRFNFQYIDDVYDFLLSIGIKPFVEIGFMPKALASSHENATLFWWNANVTPPKDYEKWSRLIRTLVQHWTDRYGKDEVKTWRFEIWNEPNLDAFWRPKNDRMAAYFELYEHTARAILSVSPEYKIGGPSGAGPVWIPELHAFCKEKNLPLDFITFHSYGLGDGPSGLDPYGNRKLYLNQNINSPADASNSQLAVLEKLGSKDTPIHITEWSASYSPRDPIHDSYFSAPYILQQLRKTEAMASMSYWTFTDIFEENGPGPAPFHGGFGLINQQGIPKSAFWAYKFLAMLGDTEIEASDPAAYVCTDSQGGVQILFWDLTHPTDGGKISNHDVFLRPHPPKDKGVAEARIENMIPGDYSVEIRKIGYRANDPYSLYLEMGKTDLTREEVAALKNASDGKPQSRSVERIGETFSIRLPMHENCVYLIVLTPLATKQAGNQQ